MTDTIVVYDEFVPTSDGSDLSTHTSDSGSGWGSESSGGASFLSMTMFTASGGYIQTTGTTARTAGSTVTFASNGDVYGEFDFIHTGSSPNSWIVGLTLFNGSARLGAYVRYLSSTTDMWAFLNDLGATTGINPLAGNPSALNGAVHTVRWELAGGTFTIKLDGATVYTTALSGVDVTGYRAALRVQSSSTADTQIRRISTGTMAAPVPVPFWTNFVDSKETL